MSVHPAGAALGLLADLVVGEPPLEPHPVAAFGRLMERAERLLYRDDRVAGALHAGVGVGVGVLAGLAVRSSALATYVAVAPHQLYGTAEAVGLLLAEGEVERARARLPALVGRDPTTLDETGIARAVVESVAENTVDAVVAPACFAAVGGAPAVAAHRALNTLDAMVGHRSARYEHFGWASARLDDAAAWVPARVTAALVALVRPAQAGAIAQAVRTQAPAHPSPNAGVAEAAFAAALGVGLGGPLRYGERAEVRPALGWGPPPGAVDVTRATRLGREVTVALAALLLLAAGGRSMTRRRTT